MKSMSNTLSPASSKHRRELMNLSHSSEERTRHWMHMFRTSLSSISTNCHSAFSSLSVAVTLKSILGTGVGVGVGVYVGVGVLVAVCVGVGVAVKVGVCVGVGVGVAVCVGV